MSLSFPPEPDDVIRDLQPLTPHFYQALEAGAVVARAFFDERGDEVEPYHFASTVRYVAKRSLGEAGLIVEVEVDDLANNGLSLTYEQYNVRIRKRDEDGLPVPGHSRVLQDFYQQSLRLLPETAERVNLLILWDILRPSFALTETLYLACPKSGGITRDSVSAHWLVQLPNPTFSQWQEPPAEPTDETEEDLGNGRQSQAE